jgi:hypothetical protein
MPSNATVSNRKRYGTENKKFPVRLTKEGDEILPRYYGKTSFYLVCYGSFPTIPVREYGWPCVLLE